MDGLDDDQRYAFAGHLDRVGVSKLMGSEASANAVDAIRRSSARAPALLQCVRASVR
jgi:hypothetical protein